METWMHKLVYFQYLDGDWRPVMIDSMPEMESDVHYRYPMPDFVDVLAMKGWEVVSAVPVEHPEPGLLLLIFKRPRDWRRLERSDEMKQWNYQLVDPALQPKSPKCSFCERDIGAHERERRLWPTDLTDDERSRISFGFLLPNREEEFGLCEDCFVDHCGGQYREEPVPGRATERIYEAPDNWVDQLAQDYAAHLKTQRQAD